MLQRAVERDFEKVLERGPVACQRRAYAVDERHDLRVVAQIEDIRVVAAMCGDHPVLENDRLGLGFERALLEPIRRVISAGTPR